MRLAYTCTHHALRLRCHIHSHAHPLLHTLQPGIEVCEKPAPPAPKPSDYTTCESCVRAGFNFQDGKCVNYCISSGGICNPCMQPPQPPKYRDCESCTRHGFSWQGNQCLNKCLLGSPYECAQRPDQCPRTPDCNDFKTCTDCTGNGFSWQGDKCLNRCLVGSPFPCVQTPAQCPVEVRIAHHHVSACAQEIFSSDCARLSYMHASFRAPASLALRVCLRSSLMRTHNYKH